ncbi:GDSL-type esterase/lipase family protein [Sphingobacterium bovisgrunnientis]|uniref:GDSL-type esterase/lipase family protein n=1 Tax=Sphingobacterium bovisgrunnientis TaxID=1874697 RepID=UPI00135AB73E|nr:GDSL-type esterase/lipase family protein [Sphingobacterium bovisgrunnientis]
MKYWGLLIVSLLGVQGVYAQAQRDLATDSTFKNWYYDSREKLYQGLTSQQVDVVFFGNSITEGGPWHELFGAKYKIANRGIGGDNTFGMKARIGDVVKSKPKKIFLMMGINDIGRGQATSWILKNYEEIIQIIKKQSPKTKIYLQSTLPLNDKVLKYDYLLGKEEKIRALNAGIVELAQKYRLQYVDVKEVLADDYVLKANYTKDGIHLTTDAYLEWAKYLKAKKYL